jgi:hypothetical protein
VFRTQFLIAICQVFQQKPSNSLGFKNNKRLHSYAHHCFFASLLPPPEPQMSLPFKLGSTPLLLHAQPDAVIFTLAFLFPCFQKQQLAAKITLVQLHFHQLIVSASSSFSLYYMCLLSTSTKFKLFLITMVHILILYFSSSAHYIILDSLWQSTLRTVSESSKQGRDWRQAFLFFPLSGHSCLKLEN